MSKYIEFKQIPFKGKTKKFEILSKTSFDECFTCLHRRIEDTNIEVFNQAYKDCKTCKGTGKVNIVLGRISWYPQWRQYTFSPAFPTIWNRECLNDIIFFINNLMEERNPKKKMKHSLKPIHNPALCLVREEALKEVLKYASPEVKACFKLASPKQIKKWEDECADVEPYGA